MNWIGLSETFLIIRDPYCGQSWALFTWHPAALQKQTLAVFLPSSGFFKTLDKKKESQGARRPSEVIHLMSWAGLGASGSGVQYLCVEPAIGCYLGLQPWGFCESDWRKVVRFTVGTRLTRQWWVALTVDVDDHLQRSPWSREHPWGGMGWDWGMEREGRKEAGSCWRGCF